MWLVTSQLCCFSLPSVGVIIQQLTSPGFCFWSNRSFYQDVKTHPPQRPNNTNKKEAKEWIEYLPGNKHTVDGRNPAPVDRWFIPLFTGFYTSGRLARFLNHQLNHQQYRIPAGTLESMMFPLSHLMGHGLVPCRVLIVDAYFFQMAWGFPAHCK